MKNSMCIIGLSYTREFLVYFKIYTSPLIENSWSKGYLFKMIENE